MRSRHRAAIGLPRGHFRLRASDERTRALITSELASVAADLAVKARSAEPTPRGSYELGLAVRSAIVEHNLRDKAFIDIARRLSDPRPDARLDVGAALKQLSALARLSAPGGNIDRPHAPAVDAERRAGRDNLAHVGPGPRGRGLAPHSPDRNRKRALLALAVGGLAAIALVRLTSVKRAPTPLAAVDSVAPAPTSSAAATPPTSARAARKTPGSSCRESSSEEASPAAAGAELRADGMAAHFGSRRLAVDDQSARAVVGDWDGDGAVGPGFVAATWVALWREVPAAGMATPPDALARVKAVAARVDDLNGDGRDEIVAVDPDGAVVVVDLQANCLAPGSQPPRIR